MEGARLSGFVIKMWRAATIEGHVRGAQGRSPASKVRLTHLPSGTERTAWCDVDGRFLFARLLPGRYSIAVVGGGADVPGAREARLLDLDEATRLEIELTGEGPQDR